MITVATNGCFDVLHAGHVDSLKRARALGDYLVVGLNSDYSVRQLKGEGRPLLRQQMRKEMLEAIRWVDKVVIVDSTDMVEFLRGEKPQVWCKAGYTLETLNPREVEVARELNIQIVLLEPRHKVSTSSILDSLRSL